MCFHDTGIHYYVISQKINFRSWPWRRWDEAAPRIQGADACDAATGGSRDEFWRSLRLRLRFRLGGSSVAEIWEGHPQT